MVKNTEKKNTKKNPKKVLKNYKLYIFAFKVQILHNLWKVLRDPMVERSHFLETLPDFLTEICLARPKFLPKSFAQNIKKYKKMTQKGKLVDFRIQNPNLAQYLKIFARLYSRAFTPFRNSGCILGDCEYLNDEGWVVRILGEAKCSW